MERIMSDEEKIRRAIEISQRRNNNSYKSSMETVKVNEKKDYKLFKKMLIQILICLLIYIIFYIITTNNYVLSADIIKTTNDVLNYDINFNKIYSDIKAFGNINNSSNEILDTNLVIEGNCNKNVVNTIEESEQEGEDNKEVEKNENTQNIIVNEDDNKESEEEVVEKEEKDNVAKTQMELDVERIKKICNLKSPLKGKITSEFGQREATIDGMTTDHKGIDIAANKGTSIKAAMEGTVKVAEENSEYGKFIKIVNKDVMTVYAHCQKLKVKVGDKVKIGQTIATVRFNRGVNRSTFTF